MKNNIITSIFITTLLLSGNSFAENIKKELIVVVDVEKIMTESSAGKDLSKKLEESMNNFQKKYSAKEESLRKERDSIQKKQSVLSQEAFEKEVKAFQLKAGDLQKIAHSEREEIEKAKQYAIEQIDSVAKEITKQLANEKGFSLVAPTSTIIFYDDKLEITKELLERINKKITKVNFEFRSKS